MSIITFIAIIAVNGYVGFSIISFGSILVLSRRVGQKLMCQMQFLSLLAA